MYRLRRPPGAADHRFGQAALNYAAMFFQGCSAVPRKLGSQLQSKSAQLL